MHIHEEQKTNKFLDQLYIRPPPPLGSRTRPNSLYSWYHASYHARLKVKGFPNFLQHLHPSKQGKTILPSMPLLIYPRLRLHSRLPWGKQLYQFRWSPLNLCKMQQPERAWPSKLLFLPISSTDQFHCVSVVMPWSGRISFRHLVSQTEEQHRIWL